MSTTVDQRVVEMSFDNANFERNVKTSLLTLDKLKKALKFEGATKGIEAVQEASKKVTLAPMCSAADAVAVKFSHLQMTIQRQIDRTVDGIVDSGKRMIKALTIDPVKTGLSEYETQINAVQTILANTSHAGTTLDEVNNALDTLNKYADMTIYNFTEMTRNIGTFTAAGVDLQTSVDSIQGIANLAAVSGSTSQQASTAMYQLSQALAAGKVTLMDWNSVVNAGMGGKVFQDALIRTSELLGTGAENAIKSAGSFRESLTKTGWLTTEVLTETLSQFAGAYSEADLIAQGFTQDQAKAIAAMAVTATDAATKVKTFTQLWDTLQEAAQSGWTQTWELIIGDFEEAKELLTSISDTVGDIINKTSDSRNNLLGAALKSPWKKFVEELGTADVSVDKFQNKVRELYDAANGEDSFDKLVAESKSFEKACRSGKISSDMLKQAINDLNGSTSNLDNVTESLGLGSRGDAVKEVQNALQKLGYEFEKYGADGIIGSETEDIIKKFQEANELEITGIVDDATLAKLRELTSETNVITKSFDEMIDSLDDLGGREKIIAGLSNIFTQLSVGVRSIGVAFKRIIPAITSDDLGNAFDKFYNFATNFKIDAKAYINIQRIASGLFSIVHLAMTISGGVVSAAFKLLSSILSAFGMDVLTLAGNIGKVITEIHDWIYEGNILARLMKQYIDSIPGLVNGFRDWFVVLGNTAPVKAFVSLVTKLYEHIRSLGTMDLSIESVKTWATGFKDIFVEICKSVPDMLQQVKTSISDTLDNITGGRFSKAVESFKALFDTPEMEAFVQSLSRLGNGLMTLITKYISPIADIASSIYSKCVTIGTNIIDGLQNGLSGGAGSVVSKILEVATDLINAFCDMLGIHSPSTVAMSWGKFIIMGLVMGLLAYGGLTSEAGQKIIEDLKKSFSESELGSIFDSLSQYFNVDAVRKLVDNVTKELGELDFEQIFVASGVVMIYKTVKHVLSTIESFTKPLESIDELLKSGKSVMDALSKTIKGLGTSAETMAKAYSKNQNREAMLKTAIALGVLVAAIAALVYVAGDNYGAIWNAVGVVAALAAVLVILSALMNKFGSAAVSFDTNTKKLNASGLKQSMISLGAAILLLGLTIKLIGDMNPDEAEQGIKGLIAVMMSLLSFVIVTSTMTKHNTNLNGFGKSMKQMAVAMLLMLAVIKLSSMMDNDGIMKGLIVLEALALISIQMALANRVAGNAAKEFGKNMKRMAVAFGLLVGVIYLISRMDPGDIVIGLVVLEIFVLLSMEMAVANRIAGTNATKFGSTMIKMALAIGLLAGLSYVLAEVGLDPFLKGVGIMQIFILVIAEMLVVAKLGEKTKGVGSTLLMLSLAITMLAGVAYLIGAIDTKQLIKGVAAISILGLIIAAMLKAAQGVEKAVPVFMSVTAAIAILAGVMFAVSMMPTENLVSGVAAMSTLMIMFTIITKMASGITATKSLIAGLGSMLIVVAILAGILLAIDKLNVTASIETIGSLVLMMLTLAASCKIIDNVKVSASSVIAMAALSLVVGILGLVLRGLQELDIQTNVQTVIALSTLLLAMAGVTAILSIFGQGSLMAAGEGVLALVVVIAVLGAFIGALGGLMTYVPEAQQFLDAGIPVLESIGVGIGKFVGGIIGGVGSGIAGQLTEIGTALTTFVNGFADVDPNAFSGVSSIAKCIAIIGGASIIDGIANFLNFSDQTPMEQFMTSAVQLVTTMITVSGMLKGVTIENDKIDAVAKAGELFAALAKSIPSSDGLLQKLTGVKDLGAFGSDIVKYVTQLNMINIALKGMAELDVDRFSDFAKVGTKFSKLANSIPSSGGIIDKITGVKDLGEFGADIVKYVVQIDMINLALTNTAALNVDKFTDFAKVGTDFSKLAKSIPSSKGLIDKITGIRDLGEFGTDIGTYVEQLATANEKIPEDFSFNSDALSQLIDAGTAMSGLEESLSGMDGIIDWFTGSQDLGTFGENVGTYADAVLKLAEVSITDDQITNIENVGVAILSINESLPSEGFFDSKISMDDFSDYIENFAEALKSFNDTSTDLESTNIDLAVKTAERIKDLIDKIASIDDSGIANFTGIGIGGVGADGMAYKIGKAMAEFSDSVKDIDTQAVNVATSAAIRIKTLISNLAGLDYSGVELFKPDVIAEKISDYATKLSNLSLSTVDQSIVSLEKLKGFISSLAGLNTSGVASFTSSMTTLAESNISGAVNSMKESTKGMSSVGSSMISSLTQGMNDSASSLESTSASLMSSLTSGFNNKGNDMSKAGSSLIANFINGIAKEASSVYAKAVELGDKAASGIRAKYLNMYTSGTYLGSGLINGINAKKTDVYNAAYALGQEAVRGEKDGQASHSPSKLTMQAGKWFGEGLIIGIGQMTSKVYESGRNLGDTATKALSKAVRNTNDLIDGGVDVNPTIRPVIDLSEVNRGAAAISNMLAAENSINVGMNTNARAVNTAMSNRNQNGVNDDIVSAISKLSKQLDKVGNTTYNLNGITYDDGSNISEAVGSIVRAARIGRRV